MYCFDVRNISMERNRGKSASPATQLRPTQRSTNSLVASHFAGSSGHLESFSPRTGFDARISTSEQRLHMPKSSSAVLTQKSMEDSLHSVHSTPRTTVIKSYSSRENVEDFNSTLAPGQSAIVRSKSSFSIHTAALSQAPNPTISSSNLEIAPHQSLPLNTSPSIDNFSAGEGFLFDVESKNFIGVWNHPITR